MGVHIFKWMKDIFLKVTAGISPKRNRVNSKEVLNTEMLRQQNEYYRTQYEDMTRQWTTIRKIWHDMGNAYILEAGYLERGEYEKLREIYRKRLGEVRKRQNSINTGNMGVDSILNYKEATAGKMDIEIKREIKTKGQINIADEDMNALLGNLLDNAMEAVSKTAVRRKTIEYKLVTDETALLFEIHNVYDGALLRGKNGEIKTLKQNQSNHGIGLRTVKEIAAKYNGIVDIRTENNFFSVKVFLYYGCI